MWEVPWTTAEIIDFVFLSVATFIVTAVPIIYGTFANWHDRLARAVVAGTGATAFAFVVAMVFMVLRHTGWEMPESTRHWVARLIYTAVALGKLMLLIALLEVLRNVRRANEAAGLRRAKKLMTDE